MEIELEITTQTVPSITSLQIAELVESRHDDVKRSIERLANQGVIVHPPTADVLVTSDKRARTYGTRVYTFSGEQGKRDSTVVVVQMSPEYTARLVDRWMELEAQVRQPSLDPRNLSRAQLLQIAVEAEQERQALEHQVAEQAPKVEAYDHLVEDDTLYLVREAAKHLAVKPRKFVTWLLNNGWAYRHGTDGRLLGYQDKLDNGLLAHKIEKFWNWRTLMNDTSANLRITSKGLIALTRRAVPALAAA